MNLELSEIIISIMLPVLLGLMAIFSLTTGLRAVLTKRPFLISNKWWLSILFVVFIPTILLNFSLSLPNSFNPINWVTPLIIGPLLLMMYYQLKGYTAYAVTDKSFREALLAALQKLQLPYEESLSVIRLTSVEADLQVSVQSWMGTGIIKVKQRGYNSVLRQIAHAMNEYFRNSSVPTNMISCVFDLVTGTIVVILAIGMIFLRRYFLTI